MGEPTCICCETPDENDVTGPAGASATTPAGPPDPKVEQTTCQCSHREDAHLPDLSRLCRVCGISTQGAPTGHCMGWEPPDPKVEQGGGT